MTGRTERTGSFGTSATLQYTLLIWLFKVIRPNCIVMLLFGVSLVLWLNNMLLWFTS